MHSKRIWLLSVILTLVLTLTLIPGITGCTKSTPTPAAEAETLKIGGCMPLSGPPSAAGIAWKQGWELAVDKINADGGFKVGDTTYKITLMVEDSKASAEGGTTAATKLCFDQGVKFIMGDIADFMIPPIHKVTSEAGALFCESLLAGAVTVPPPGGYGDVGPDKPLLIRMTPATSEVDIIPIEYLAKNYPDVKTIGVMSLAFPDYDPLAEKAAADWAPLGLKVGAGYERFAPDYIDFNPTVTRMLAAKPDAIMDFRSTLSQYPLILKSAREMGFNGPFLFPLPADPLYAAETIPGVSDVITGGFTMDDPSLPDAVKAVIALGRAKYGDNLIEDSIFAYDQVMLLTQIMQKAKSIEPQKVQDTFETLTKKGDLDSIFGPAYVGGLKTTGVNRVLIRPNPLSRLVNGKGEFLGMFSVDIP